jgi:hypothetical protein
VEARRICTTPGGGMPSLLRRALRTAPNAPASVAPRCSRRYSGGHGRHHGPSPAARLIPGAQRADSWG